MIENNIKAGKFPFFGAVFLAFMILFPPVVSVPSRQSWSQGSGAPVCSICGGRHYDSYHSGGSSSGSSGSGRSSTSSPPADLYYYQQQAPRETEEQRERRQRKEQARKENDIGGRYYKNREYEAALHYFEKAHSLDPDEPVFEQSLMFTRSAIAKGKGFKLYEQNDYAAALLMLEEALRWDPGDEETQESITIMKKYLSQEKQAEERSRSTEEAGSKIEGMIEDLAQDLRDSPRPLSPDEGMTFMDPRREEESINLPIHDGRSAEFTLPNKPDGGGTTDAGAQLKSLDKTGKWAVGVSPSGKAEEDFTHDEQAAGRSGIGFDTPGYKDSSIAMPENLGDNPWKEPVVTDADRKRIPAIVPLESERAAARRKRTELQSKLDQIKIMPENERPSDWTVRETKIKQDMSTIDNQEIYLNFSISELLRKNKGQ